jgi:Peptidase A4 family
LFQGPHAILTGVRSRLIIAAVAAVGALAVPGGAAAAVRTATSSNWSGYVASKTGVRFSRVAAFWTVPVATCTAGRSRYSAAWVGLGGFHTRSKALEQVGTESDCRADGTARYASWYELVPDAAHTAHLTVKPGDQVAASVVVSGHDVRLRLVNVTRGTSFVKHLHAAAVDTTSADWIVEAPSACGSNGSCFTLPLANFGTLSFAAARATSAGGHVGTIADPAWATTALTLVAASGHHAGPGFTGPPPDDGTRGGATPAPLAATGDAFGVQYG